MFLESFLSLWFTLLNGYDCKHMGSGTAWCDDLCFLFFILEHRSKEASKLIISNQSSSRCIEAIVVLSSYQVMITVSF